ncbi:MAG: ABC transporter substrate binding protein [Rubrivivax sp.]
MKRCHLLGKTVCTPLFALRGGKPAEMPIEQPSRYELFINLKTAKAIGVTIAQSLLLRAYEVIE